MTEQSNPPVLFTFGLHAHQPEGNFGHVFEDHLRDVYEPFLRKAMEGNLLPLTLHISGPLLEWLDGNNGDYLDLIGRLASEGKVELLLSGFYEPILPSLLKEDRLKQIVWMREALYRRFGVEARGLWLTERVWEPELAADLVEAGVEYVLVDDRHFVASGFSRDALHTPFRTEASGKRLGVFAIDEKLRYLIPFQPPEDTASYLKTLRANGSRLAVAADDIEKFGGWPGTREWVYERGWLDRFIRVMKELQEGEEIQLATFSEAFDRVPSGGLVYLPSASYREMEEWALPSEAHARIAELKEILGEERFTRGESPLIRGSHWRNFLVKYPEANRMHKKMLALSNLCWERGDPEAPRRALGRSQCNDAYWHGVFGGLYLRHLRDTVWRNLAEAEGLLRSEEMLDWEERDMDLDGHTEIWVHSSEFSSVVTPHRGGALEELTRFRSGVNLANTLTRRREPYHQPGRLQDGHGKAAQEPAEIADQPSGGRPRSEADSPGEGPGGGSAPSIHDLEGGLRFAELPPVDPDDRAIFLERILAADVSEAAYRSGAFSVIRSWARRELALEEVTRVAGPEGTPLSPTGMNPNPEVSPTGESALAVEVRLSSLDHGGLRKTLLFRHTGIVEARFAWDASQFPTDAFFTTELSLGGEAELDVSPKGEIWHFPVSTFSKSERGFDETVQGESVLVRWPVGEGMAWLKLSWG